MWSDTMTIWSSVGTSSRPINVNSSRDESWKSSSMYAIFLAVSSDMMSWWLSSTGPMTARAINIKDMLHMQRTTLDSVNSNIP